MKPILIFTVLATGLLTLIFYSTVNYLLFEDFGFIPAGRIVFTTNFGYYDYLILPLGILIGSMVYRKINNVEEFGKLFKFGFQTTILASVLFSGFIYVYLQFIEPAYFHKLINLIQQTETDGKQLSLLEQEMLKRAKSIEETEMLRSAYFYSIANFFVYFMVGTISSLLFAAVLKKKSN